MIFSTWIRFRSQIALTPTLSLTGEGEDSLLLAGEGSGMR